MSYSTAMARLKKEIFFDLVTQLNKNICYRCGGIIEKHQDLSIDHKQGWINSEDPYKYFFDKENIGFSHLRCNSIAPVMERKKYFSKEERSIAKNLHKKTYRKRDKTNDPTMVKTARRERYIRTGN